MTIPSQIHQSLTAPERVRVAISAMARGDDEELQTIKATCRKRSFLITDPDFTDAIERLIYLSLAVESELQGYALDFLLSSHLEEYELVIQARVSAHALESAWTSLLEEQGIPREDMAKAGPPRHHAVESILRLSREEPDEKAVEFILNHLRESFAS